MPIEVVRLGNGGGVPLPVSPLTPMLSDQRGRVDAVAYVQYLIESEDETWYRIPDARYSVPCVSPSATVVSMGHMGRMEHDR